MPISCPEKTGQGNTPGMGNGTVGLGNSERIRLKFGSYGIEVVESGQRIRVSNLYSIHDGVRTNRTFAVVAYPEVIEPEFSGEHEAIIGGQSIGNVFKNNGWHVDKRHQFFSNINLPASDSVAEAVFGDIGEIQPVIHVYSLFVKKHGAEFLYATIAEVHHPEYLGLDDLRTIYGDELIGVAGRKKDVSDFLDIVRAKMGVSHTQ